MSICHTKAKASQHNYSPFLHTGGTYMSTLQPKAWCFINATSLERVLSLPSRQMIVTFYYVHPHNGPKKSESIIIVERSLKCTEFRQLHRYKASLLLLHVQNLVFGIMETCITYTAHFFREFQNSCTLILKETWRHKVADSDSFLFVRQRSSHI